MKGIGKSLWRVYWKLLDDPYFGDFIKDLYKTIRKEDSGIGLIVQDVPDIIHPL